MIPVNYDLLISGACFIAGVYMLWRIGSFSKRKYTSALACVVITVGLVAWAIIGLISFSAIFEYPELFFSKGWKGSWGYTSSRFFMAIMWVLALLFIRVYAPKSQTQSKVIF